MKKLFIIGISLLSFFLISCKDSDSENEKSLLNKIVGNVEHMDFFEEYALDSICLTDKENFVHAKALLQDNGNFKIPLPSDIDNAVLDNLSLLLPSGFLSDKKAKGAGMLLQAKKTGAAGFEGMVIQANIDYYVNCLLPDVTYSLYYLLFVDRYTLVKGDITTCWSRTEIYNMELKKGWNLVYIKNYGNTTEYMTNVGDASLKWYFYQNVAPGL